MVSKNIIISGERLKKKTFECTIVISMDGNIMTYIFFTRATFSIALDSWCFSKYIKLKVPAIVVEDEIIKC